MKQDIKTDKENVYNLWGHNFSFGSPSSSSLIVVETHQIWNENTNMWVCHEGSQLTTIIELVSFFWSILDLVLVCIQTWGTNIQCAMNVCLYLCFHILHYLLWHWTPNFISIIKWTFLTLSRCGHKENLSNCNVWSSPETESATAAPISEALNSKKSIPVHTLHNFSQPTTINPLCFFTHNPKAKLVWSCGWMYNWIKLKKKKERPFTFGCTSYHLKRSGDYSAGWFLIISIDLTQKVSYVRARCHGSQPPFQYLQHQKLHSLNIFSLKHKPRISNLLSLLQCWFWF